MTTPFVTLSRRVEIAEFPHWIEAHEPGTGRLLGVASRTRSDADWSGWIVTVGDHQEAAASRDAALDQLRLLASETLQEVSA